MESFDYTFYLIQSIHEPGSYTYVGSTRNLNQRKSRHKKNCNDESCKDYTTKLYQMIRRNGGWDFFEIIELEYHHYTEQQAHEYEQHLIDQIHPTMNSVRASTGLSRTDNYRKEYYNKYYDESKQYQIDNAEHIKQVKKQYHIDNAEYIKQRAKQWSIDNSEYVKQRAKQYRIDNNAKINQKHKCECGGSYTTKHKAEHEKSKKHLTWILGQNQ